MEKFCKGVKVCGLKILRASNLRRNVSSSSSKVARCALTRAPRNWEIRSNLKVDFRLTLHSTSTKKRPPFFKKRFKVDCYFVNSTNRLLKRAEVYEIFRVRLETPPAEVFSLPDLTVCQTSHTPEIPTMSARAWHSKLEVKDYIYGMGSEMF